MKGNIDKKIKGYVIERMLVDIPRNKPANKKFKYNLFCLNIIFTENNKYKLKKNKKIVSDNICEHIIIISGEIIADKNT